MEDEKIMKNNENEEVVGIFEWMISNILMSIPIVGTIMTLRWSFSTNVKNSKKNWARSMVALWGVMFIFIGSSMQLFNKSVGIVIILIGVGLIIIIKGQVEVERENVINEEQVQSIKIMTVWKWLILVIVSIIPIIGHIVIIIVAVSSKGSKKNWAIASLLTVFITQGLFFLMSLGVVGVIGSFATDFTR